VDVRDDSTTFPVARCAPRGREVLVHACLDASDQACIRCVTCDAEIDPLEVRAVEAMRRAMDRLAPMLFIGEKVGHGGPNDPEVDIAVNPLEGTNLCATGAPGAIAVLAAANEGGLLHAPDCHMEKIIVGPAARNAIDVYAPAADNLKAIARSFGRDVDDLVVIVLDRLRHEQLVADIRSAGARIKLISEATFPPGSPRRGAAPTCMPSWGRAARPRGCWRWLRCAV
jgi:hypothetical protein